MTRLLRWLPLGLLFIGLFLPVLAFPAGASLKPQLLTVARYAWYGLALCAPILWLSSGSIVSKTGVSTREKDPFGFWLGVATYTLVLWGVAAAMHWALTASL